MLFQALLIVFSIFALRRGYRQRRSGIVGRFWFWSWMVLWTAVAIAAVIPKFTDRVAQTVGVERGADLFVYIAVVFLLYAVFRLMHKHEQTQRQLTELVRKIALEKERDH